MTFFPIDKYLAQDYRNTLGTNDAPQNLDTDAPIVPIVDIQKGLPRPNSKQKLIQGTIQTTADDTYIQIATVSSTRKIYLVGWEMLFLGANSQGIEIFDATSGNSPAFSSVAIQTLTSSKVYIESSSGTNRFAQHNFMLPMEMLYGIRLHWGASVAGNTIINLYWIEEVV